MTELMCHQCLAAVDIEIDWPLPHSLLHTGRPVWPDCGVTSLTVNEGARSSHMLLKRKELFPQLQAPGSKAPWIIYLFWCYIDHFYLLSYLFTSLKIGPFISRPEIVRCDQTWL